MEFKIIKRIGELDKNKWSDFVYNHPNGNIFQTSEMYEVYQNSKNYEPVFLAVVNGKGEIAGTLLAVIQKEYSGLLGNFTARSIIHGGPLIKDDDPDILDFILKEYNEIIKKKYCNCIASFYNSGKSPCCISIWKNYWEMGIYANGTNWLVCLVILYFKIWGNSVY